jgi:hypothetical protein
MGGLLLGAHEGHSGYFMACHGRTLGHCMHTQLAAICSYDQVKGWFGACNGPCVKKRETWERENHKYLKVKATVDAQIFDAKSKVAPPPDTQAGTHRF